MVRTADPSRLDVLRSPIFNRQAPIPVGFLPVPVFGDMMQLMEASPGPGETDKARFQHDG